MMFDVMWKSSALYRATMSPVEGGDALILRVEVGGLLLVCFVFNHPGLGGAVTCFVYTTY